MEIVQINQADMLQAINRSEVDIQIATAKSYPRNIDDALRRMKALATLDPETAENCFYALKRGGEVIEGVSVRMAEIIATSWGNLRVQAQIIGNDGKFITARGVAHDLETNFAASVEVKRRITDRNGKTYNDDMQVMTGNAAASIAFRNAVMKVVPSAVTHKIINDVRKVAKGEALSLETRVANSLKWFEGVGVDKQRLLAHLQLSSVSQISEEHADYLRGLAVAIKEGSTTVKETFGEETKTQSEQIAEAAKQRAAASASKAAQAIAKATTAPKKQEEPSTLNLQ